MMTLITALILVADKVSPFMLMGIIYSFIPLMDEIFSLDSINPTSAQRRELIKNESYFLAPLYTAVIISWIV